MFKCLSCGHEVIYCGIPVAHHGRILPLQNTDDHERHGCGGGGMTFPRDVFIVPLFDGQTILCIELSRN